LKNACTCPGFTLTACLWRRYLLRALKPAVVTCTPYSSFGIREKPPVLGLALGSAHDHLHWRDRYLYITDCACRAIQGPWLPWGGAAADGKERERVLLPRSPHHQQTAWT